MTYREHLLRWQKAYEDRGTMYMVQMIQEMLDDGRDTEDDVQKELDKWLEIKHTTRIYGTRHSEAWAKSDMLKELMSWWGKDFTFTS